MTTGDDVATEEGLLIAAAMNWHVVSVLPTWQPNVWRLDCAPGCDGPDPHMHGELVDDTADLDGHA